MGFLKKLFGKNNQKQKEAKQAKLETQVETQLEAETLISEVKLEKEKVQAETSVLKEEKELITLQNVVKSSPFRTTIKKTDLGIISTLQADVILSVRTNISYAEKTLIASTVYTKGGTLVYTIIDTEGKEESFLEDNYMILPTLFLTPEQKNYVSVVHIPSKEMEISIPVFNRVENSELPKTNRPFVGDFIGTSNQFSIFYAVDIWSDSKPDKMHSIEFKNGEIKKKHNIKIELPRKNKIFISTNEIHLLAKDKESWLHRQIDEKGKEIKQRQIHSNKIFYREIIHLSFDTDSFLLFQEEGKVMLEKVDVNGNCTPIELIDIVSPFYNTWKPEKIAENTYVIQFNSEFGNGWFTVQNDQLLEFFYREKGKGYKNWVTNELFEISEEELILSGINKTAENAYSVVFYPSKENSDEIKKMLVLNRTIN